jgi:flagellar export protein FliJ
MKRFRFKLQPLLSMKTKMEKDIARNLAIKNQETLLVKKQLEQCRDRLAAFQESEKSQREGFLDPQLLKMSVSYRYQLQHDILDKIHGIAGLEKEIRTITQSLIDAKKETRALEIIMEKKQAQWKKEYQRADRKFIDDLSQKRSFKNAAMDDRAYSFMV